MRITFKSQPGSIRIIGQELADGAIETFAFSNGTTLDRAQVLALMTGATDGADTINGTALSDNLTGTAKLGDNILISTSTFTRANGATGTLGNAALAYRPGSTPVARMTRNDLPERPINLPFDDSVPFDDSSAAMRAADALVASLSRTTVRGVLGGASTLWTAEQSGMLNPFDHYSDAADESTALDAGGVSNSTSGPADEQRSGRTILEAIRVVGNDNSPIESMPMFDRRLAMIVQDMAAFAPNGAADQGLGLRRYQQRPVDFYA